MRRSLALLLVCASVAAACDGAPEPPSGARTLSIETPDGEQLDALEIGTGPDVAILSHGATGTREGYFSFMPVLAEHGWRAIAYDARGVGASTGESGPNRDVDLAAVVEHARSSGAKTIVLVGASLGAALSLSDAKELGADGVVGLSGFLDGTGAGEIADSLEGIDVVLAVAQDNEPYATDTKELAETLGIEPIIVSGDNHGAGMFAEHPELMERIAIHLDDLRDAE
jgi:dienelactone hydrolase